MKTLFLNVVFIIAGSNFCFAGIIDPAFQKRCNDTFKIPKFEAVTFLANGRRVTPRECCKERICETLDRDLCKTEEFRSLIQNHFKHTCPAGQSVGVTNWCVGHLTTRCTDIDECETNNTCHPNNTDNCTNTDGSYICYCKPGFAGKNCQINIDECASNPCQNSVSCIDHVNRFECVCRPGYTGPTCGIVLPLVSFGGVLARKYEVRHITDCASAGLCCESKNNTCYVPNSMKLSGEIGNCFCDAICLQINDCCVDFETTCKGPCQALGMGVNRCRNSGTCVSNGSSWTCLCQPGYSGSICHIDIDECKTNYPCVRVNSFNCTNTDGSYTCNCNPGFTGKNCQIDIDECASNPCQNSGSCIDHVNRFECVCRPGYTGPTCGIDIDECASSPCQNGATCADFVNFFRCTCAPGFYGTLCDTNICRPLPADVVFVLDSSISMTESQFQKQLEFVTNFTNEVRLGPRDFQISVITFSTKAHIEFYLDQYRDNATIKEAIGNITYKPGVTFTHLALEAVKTVFGTGHGGNTPRYNNTLADRFVYLMTDGMSNDRRASTNVAKELRDNLAITISVIGIGSQVSHEELLQLASKKVNGGGTIPSVYSVNNFDSLYTVLKELVHVTCEACTRSRKSDVAIIMDASSSMTDIQFQIGKNALMHIVDGMNLGENETQLSLTTFDSTINEIFTFNDYTDTRKIIPIINSIPKASGSSRVDIADVINDVKDNILPKGRPDSRAFFLIFTNGNFSRNSEDSTVANAHEEPIRIDGVQMIVVGTGDGIVYGGLLALASDPFNVYKANADEAFGGLDVIKTYLEYSECDLQ